jgi:type IV secretion system protein VirD4
MEDAAGARMKARASNGSEARKWLIGGIFFLVLISVFGVGGQFVGGQLFGMIEKLPQSAIGVGTLYRYWGAYRNVAAVRRWLLVSGGVSVLITAVPVAILLMVLISGKFKSRELHGSARFASIREIRESGLVGKDHD